MTKFDELPQVKIKPAGWDDKEIAQSNTIALPYTPAPEFKQTTLQTGWICPVCGAGVSPYTSVCPCNMNKW